jgi:hypothetical protein
MEELSDIKVLLENMDNAEDELTPQAKKWRKDIIDMSYDIEDCVDNFLDRVGGCRRQGGGPQESFSLPENYQGSVPHSQSDQ